MYSLHPPSVTVNCVDCYRYNHCKLCTKLFVRFMPQINRRFTDCHKFPRSIGVKSIFVVKSHNRDATRKFATATTRRNFATNFHSALCPPLSSCRNPPNSNGSTNCHDIHQFLLLWQYDCGLRLQVCPFQGCLLQSDPTRSSSF